LKQRKRYGMAALGAGTAVAVSVVVIARELHALSPRGSAQELLPSYVAMFPVMACGLLFPLACIFLAPARTRRAADAVATFCLAYLVVGILGVFAADRVRMRAFAELARRSEPLVAAIHAFENDASRPPTALNELVPRYLRIVPGTGMGAYPQYDYDARGSEWTLIVPASTGPFSWDRFEYGPSERKWSYVTD
jgi:hypothetical protein